MNILVIRSIRIEEMPFAYKEIKEKFKNCKFTILTDKFNENAIIKLDDNINTLIYSKGYYKYDSKYINEINQIKNINFKKVIIPTNGNINGYSNIEKFIKKIHKKPEIYFFRFPDMFIKSKNNIYNKLIDKIILFFSSCLSIFVLLFYFSVFILKLILNKFNK